MTGRLGAELINQLTRVAVWLEFYDRRQVLLLRIPRDFQSTMPVARGERMRDQLVSDLNYLNEAGILSDGSDPLRTWLSNAIDAAGGVQEEAVFQSALAELDQQARNPGAVSRGSSGTAVRSQPSLDSLIDEITGRDARVSPRLTLADLTPVIRVVAGRLADLGQVQMIVALSGLTGIRYPVAHASAMQLWVAVFEAVLDAPPETFATLLKAISDELGARSKADLEAALREVSRQLGEAHRR